MVICVPAVEKPPVARVHRVGGGDRSRLLPQFPGLRPVSALPRCRQPPLHRLIGRIRRAPVSPRVLRDKVSFNELIQLMQVDVTQDGRNDPALRNAAECSAVFPVLQVPGFQHVTDKPQEPLVMDLLRQDPEKDLMVETAEAVKDVTFNEPRSPGPGVAYL